MTDAQRTAIAAAIDRPADGLTVEPVTLPGAPACTLVRIRTDETGPAGTRYALQSGDRWLTFRDTDALAKAFAACGDATAATLALLTTALSRQAGALTPLTEARPGFVIRALNAAGWTFQPPAVQPDGTGQRLDFLAIGPDGPQVSRVTVTWTPGTAPVVEVAPAPQ